MMCNFVNKFGSQYSKPKGYVIEPKNTSGYNHRFGGSSWKIVDAQPEKDEPVLLFVLDLSDPKLSGLGIRSLEELPVCSYINSDTWLHEQVYKINRSTKEVLLLNSITAGVNTLDSEDQLPTPLPEKFIDLRDMNDSEYPIDEDSYWKNTDNFLGGQSFFRVAGNPLWLQKTKTVYCSCGVEMNYIMSIGYEGWDGEFQYIDEMPFFLGESALYIFFCDSCDKLKVISQTS